MESPNGSLVLNQPAVIIFPTGVSPAVGPPRGWSPGRAEAGIPLRPPHPVGLTPRPRRILPLSDSNQGVGVGSVRQPLSMTHCFQLMALELVVGLYWPVDLYYRNVGLAVVARKAMWSSPSYYVCDYN